MNRLFASVAFVVLVSSAASAADLPAFEPAAVVAPLPSVFDWGGVYVGVQGGYAWGEDDYEVAGEDTSFDVEGAMGGGHVGANIALGGFIVGVEGDGEWADLDGDFTADNGDEVGTDVEWQASIRGRLGFAWDRFHVYATGGGAFAGVDNRIFDLSTSTTETEDDTRTGYTVGGGVEVMVTQSIIGGVEYRYTDFSDEEFESEIFPLDTFESDLTTHAVRGRVSYKFNGLFGG